MKQLILIIFLAIGVTQTSNAQATPFLKVSIDPKMAVQGPHPDNPDYSSSSLDIEFQLGFEIGKHIRVSTAFQSHKEIYYKKYTFLMVDYMLKDFPFKNINCYAGLEWGSIFRSELNGWRDTEASMWHYGANAEVQWMFSDNFGISSHINFFRAEPTLLRDNTNHRYEVMIGLVGKL